MTKARPVVAILGATGHIGQVLANWMSRDATDLLVVARDLARAGDVAVSVGRGETADVATFEDLRSRRVDALVNCVGIGDPGRLSSAGAEIYALTQRFDDICMEYVETHPETVYVSMSSGAVYGTEFAEPARDDSVLRIGVNAIGDDDHYSIAKLAAEARHRAAKSARIVDLRIFGLFSRYIDPDASYLVNEMVRCVKTDSVLQTDTIEVTRDYVHPADLAALVEGCIIGPVANGALDVASRAPVAKSELLKAFGERYGLQWRYDSGLALPSATGRKPHYYSMSRRAWDTGWEPKHSALEAVLAEADHLLAAHGGDHG